MLKILSKFEYVLNGTLLFMLAFVVLLATIDLVPKKRTPRGVLI